MLHRAFNPVAASVGVAALGLSLAGAAPAPAPLPAMKPLPWGQAHYYEGCGGCHGLEGISAKREVPVLRDSVGAFLCSAAGRRYIIQLPNVAFANMDDRTLAETMNFVVFGLGRDSVPAGARPYSAAEVGSLRRFPLKNQPLARMREAVLNEGAAGCRKTAQAAAASAVTVR
jgi:hypothetical protein